MKCVRACKAAGLAFQGVNSVALCEQATAGIQQLSF